MCGINGLLDREKREGLSRTVTQMNSSLSHRGPDDSGVWSDGDIALGHQRLSILDLSDAGHQPMQSEDGRYVIVFNGEIYNFKKIRQELGDYPFNSETDTEVILASYKKWGADCLNRFNGMFAFAIWDKVEEELFAARDRLGIKPFYYYGEGDRFIFSSEVRALLDSGLVPRKLNRQGIPDYLRYQTVHAPFTMVKDVHMLMPGHFLTLKDGELDTNRYWEAESYVETTAESQSYKEVKDNVRNLLLESIERRLIADVPFGAFLSGGIDSSAIVGLMSEVTPGNVKTFSITFDEGEFNEAAYSNMVAEKFETDHKEIRLTPEDFLQNLPEALKAMDHPSGDGPNTYVVSKATREAGVTVALSGLGGDELFAGYSIFSRSMKLQKLKGAEHLPLPVRKLASLVIRGVSESVAAKKIAEITEGPSFGINDTYPVSRQVYLEAELTSLLNGAESVSANRVREIVGQFKHVNRPGKRLSNVSLAEINTYMQNVLLRDTDQMSMASALEVRVPFLDHKLVEYVLSLPDEYKYPSIPKKLLIDSLAGMLPDEVVFRKKMGFTFPWSHWIKNELREDCEEALASLAGREIFEKEQLMELWQQFLEGKVYWSKLWMLVVLEKWMKTNGIEV